MMKLNLNFQLKDLDGNKFEGDLSNAAKILGGALSQHTEGPVVKTMEWVGLLWKKKEIEIDETDRQLLLAFVETSKMFNNLCKSQILPAIRNAAEEKKK